MAAAVRLLTPEIALIAAAVAIYIAGAFWAAWRPWSWIAGAAVALAAGALFFEPICGTAALGCAASSDFQFYLDPLARSGRWLALGLGALLVLTAARPLISGGTPEYFGSLLLAIAGIMLVAEARDLVLLFVGLELVSIPTYILLYLGRTDAARQEAAAKYFFLSVFSSAIVLYGFSFLYGIAGSTDLAVLRDALAGAGGSNGGLGGFSKLAAALIFAGLSFRVAAVPFHFYAPDVYEGTTCPNAAFLSALPKVAGLVAMTRLLTAAAPAVGPQLWQMVLVIAMLTMTLGNVTALWQDNLRRLLAYSSIANAGYLLLALAVALATGGQSGGWDGLSAMWFYLTVYAVGTIGAFAVLECLAALSPLPLGEGPEVRAKSTGVQDSSLPENYGTVDALAGLGRTRPLAAGVLSILMLSLTGLPPLAGFWGKLLVFGSALNASPAGSESASLRWWFVVAAVVGLLNAAVGAAYYLRVVAAMYFRPPLREAAACAAMWEASPDADRATHQSAIGDTSRLPQSAGSAGPWLAGLLSAALVVGIGVYPRPWIAAARTQEKLPPPQPAPQSGVAARDIPAPVLLRRPFTPAADADSIANRCDNYPSCRGYPPSKFMKNPRGDE